MRSKVYFQLVMIKPTLSVSSKISIGKWFLVLNTTGHLGREEVIPCRR
jgi:hypothetical protein